MATGRWGRQSAAARAALVELCAVLEKSELTPALVKRHVYDNLGMVDERTQLDAADDTARPFARPQPVRDAVAVAVHRPWRGRCRGGR